MTQLNPAFDPPLDDRVGVAAALGLTVPDLVPYLPVQQVSCGVPYVLIALRDRMAVDSTDVDVGAFRTFVAANSLGADACLFVFAVSPAGSPEIAYSRMFAPGFGIVEDPATGSASGPLGCYLVRHGLVAGEAARRMVGLQGVAMGRPSRIHISIEERGGEIVRVRVGGEAVLVARGELLL